MRLVLRARVVAAAGAFCAVAIAACGADNQVTAEADEEVKVRFTDSGLDPERLEVSPGTIRFLIDNDSERPHRLAVETSNGVEESSTIDPNDQSSVFSSGDPGSLTVELAEGEYTMYDQLKNYRERDVEGVVVVSGDTDTVEGTTAE